MADNTELVYYANESYEGLVDRILKLSKENRIYATKIDELNDKVEYLENKIEDLEIDLRLSGREIEKLKGRDLI